MTDITDGRIPLHIDEPVELLSFVPYQLHFKPAESVVVITSRSVGHTHELGVISRMDIPDFVDPTASAMFQHALVKNPRFDPESDGYLVVYSEAFRASLDTDHRGQADDDRLHALGLELAHWYDQAPFTPRRTYIVGTRMWRCLTCAHPGHCPPRGHPLESLDDTRTAAHMVLQGRTFAQSRDDLVRVPPGPHLDDLPPTVQREARLARATSRRRDSWRYRMWRMWQETIAAESGTSGAGPHDDGRLALLALSLHHIPLRDNVIYALCTGETMPFPARGADDHFAVMFSGGPPPPPQFDRYLDLLQRMVGACPSPQRAPALGVWAWCNWWVGNGAEANIITDMAREVDQEYSLGHTLEMVLAAGLIPPWARG